MKYKTLGNTNITISEIGFGTWGLGGDAYGPVDEKEAISVLELAFQKGVNFYDTADLYGAGKSEEILGRTFKKVRDKVIIATKGGTLPHTGFYMPQNFSEKYLRKALEESLIRLQTDYIDFYQLHSPKIDDLNKNNILHTLEKFKVEGKIREFGISVRSPDDGLIAINKFNFPVIQVNFNLIDHRALNNGLFNLAKRKKTGIIVRTPLVFGFLANTINNFQFDRSDHRVNWPVEQLNRWKSAPDLFSFLYVDKTPVQAALRFCLDFDSVSTVIPGMISKKHVDENLVASNFPELTQIDHNKIKVIYNSYDFYDKEAKEKK